MGTWGLEGLNVIIFKLRSVRYFANAVKRSKEANMNYDNDVVANWRANPKAYRVRNFRGRVSNFNQSEARKQCVLASDWLKFVTLPQ